MPRKVFERYLREDEERKLFTTLRRQAGTSTQHQLLAMRDLGWMRLMRNTGIRVAHMAGLNVADARQALATHYLKQPAAKGGSAGKVFCNRNAIKSLRLLLKVRRRQGAPDMPDQPLVVSRQHGRMAVRSYQQRMALWRTEAELPVEASPHWMRHTFAKRILKNSTAKDPRGVAQAALNHSSIESTAIYTYPDRDDVEETLEEIAG